MSATAIQTTTANGNTANIPALAGFTAATSGQLSRLEQTQLLRCEQVLERGLKTVFEVGTALRSIREGRLYRATHRDFASYCCERWGFCRCHAWRVMGAAQRLQMLPVNGSVPLPTNEFQIRPFLALEAEAFPNAWALAVRKARNGRVTSALARALVAELKPTAGNSRRRAPKGKGRSQLGRALAILGMLRKKLPRNELDQVQSILDDLETTLFECPLSRS